MHRYRKTEHVRPVMFKVIASIANKGSLALVDTEGLVRPQTAWSQAAKTLFLGLYFSQATTVSIRFYLLKNFLIMKSLGFDEDTLKCPSSLTKCILLFYKKTNFCKDLDWDQKKLFPFAAESHNEPQVVRKRGTVLSEEPTTLYLGTSKQPCWVKYEKALKLHSVKWITEMNKCPLAGHLIKTIIEYNICHLCKKRKMQRCLTKKEKPFNS